MRTLKELNAENEKIEVYCISYVSPKPRWVNFLYDGMLAGERGEIASGRGGILLKLYSDFFRDWRYVRVKCSETGIEGKLYWRHKMKGIVDRIEWDDGKIDRQ